LQQGILRRAAKSFGMSNRLGRSHLLSHLLLACGCILLLASAAMAARPFRAVELESTPEWNRLAVLWQAMMDHSSDVIYSPTRFQELVKEVDAIDVDLAALTKRGLLPRPIAIDLKRVFHARYEYLREHYYTSESQVTLPAMESAAITAHWVVELQLGALRRANAGPEPDRKLMARAQSAIACELSFLETYERFRAEVEKRRQALVEEQKSGKDVDSSGRLPGEANLHQPPGESADAIPGFPHSETGLRHADSR